MLTLQIVKIGKVMNAILQKGKEAIGLKHALQ